MQTHDTIFAIYSEVQHYQIHSLDNHARIFVVSVHLADDACLPCILSCSNDNVVSPQEFPLPPWKHRFHGFSMSPHCLGTLWVLTQEGA